MRSTSGPSCGELCADSFLQAVYGGAEFGSGVGGRDPMFCACLFSEGVGGRGMSGGLFLLEGWSLERIEPVAFVLM